MLLSKLIYELELSDIQWIFKNNSEIEIYSLSLLKKNSQLREGILYIGYAEQLPAELPETKISFIIVAEEKLSLKALNSKTCNMILLPKNFELIDIYEKIAELLETDTIISKDKQTLFSLLDKNITVEQIIEKAHDFLKNPIILVDSSSKIIAMSEDAEKYRPDIKEQRDLGYILINNIERLQKSEIYERIRKERYPYHDKSKNLRHDWMHDNIYINDIEVAHIAIIALNHKFTRYDFEIVHFLSSLISFELRKDDYFKTNQGVIHSFFISELLNKLILNPSVLSYRLSQINWKVNSYFFTIIICVNDGPISSYKSQLIANQVSTLLKNSRWTIFEEKIVFIVSSDNSNTSQFYENNNLMDYLKTNKIIAGISNCYSSLIETNKYYNQAKISYEMGVVLNNNSYIHIYQDYIIYHIIKIIEKEFDLDDFYYPEILKIIEYDKTNNSNLLETVYKYIKYVNNPTLVAEQLHIHKNTLFYRVNKVRELFDIDLSDGEKRFYIQLTMKLIKYKRDQINKL